MARAEDMSLCCAVSGCDGGVYNIANGWCNKHYVRYWRTGSVDPQPPELRTDLSYAGAHQRVRRELGKAAGNPCVECGNPATDWAYDRTDPDECIGYQSYSRRCVYSQWPEFYMPLCRSCHTSLDNGAASEARSHCRSGHEMTRENTYTAPSKPGSRSCKQCRREAANRYTKKRRSK